MKDEDFFEGLEQVLGNDEMISAKRIITEEVHQPGVLDDDDIDEPDSPSDDDDEA